MHLPKHVTGFSGCWVVFICCFCCCWAACTFPRLTSPNSSLVHLSLWFQRLHRFLHGIFSSPSAMPLPTAHSFLYYKYNIFPGDRREKITVLSTCFSPELIDLPSPHCFWEDWETLHKINFPPKQPLKSELFGFYKSALQQNTQTWAVRRHHCDCPAWCPGWHRE